LAKELYILALVKLYLSSPANKNGHFKDKLSTFIYLLRYTEDESMFQNLSLLPNSENQYNCFL